jgi:hypothetical protein
MWRKYLGGLSMSLAAQWLVSAAYRYQWLMTSAEKYHNDVSGCRAAALKK